MNPYWGSDFFHFFSLLLSRLFKEAWVSPANDEVQLAVLSLIALSCGLIGPFLVLKKMAMFANALSHTILLGIAGAFLVLGGGVLFDLPHLLLGSLIAALATAILTEGLVQLFRLQEDASVALIFTSLFALGIVAVTLFTKDVHLGVEAVMGNVDALSFSDIRLSLMLSGLNASLLLLFFRPLQAVSFDALFARGFGLKSGSLHFLLLFLAAATCIGAFRAVGVLLVLGFLVGPYLTARLFFHRLQTLLIASPLIGIGASLVGTALARHFLTVFDLPLSTGGLVSCTIGLFYFLGIAAKKIYLFTHQRKSAILNGNEI